MVMHTSGSTVVFRSHKNLVTSSITAILNVNTFPPDELYIVYILNYNWLCPCVCHVMSHDNFSAARAVTDLNTSIQEASAAVLIYIFKSPQLGKLQSFKYSNPSSHSSRMKYLRVSTRKRQHNSNGVSSRTMNNDVTIFYS